MRRLSTSVILVLFMGACSSVPLTVNDREVVPLPAEDLAEVSTAVSYTHLTLPTTSRV